MHRPATETMLKWDVGQSGHPHTHTHMNAHTYEYASHTYIDRLCTRTQKFKNKRTEWYKVEFHKWECFWKSDDIVTVKLIVIRRSGFVMNVWVTVNKDVRKDVKVTLEINRVRIAILILPRMCLRTEQVRDRWCKLLFSLLRWSHQGQEASLIYMGVD